MYNQLMEDYKQAMRDKDAIKKTVLSFVIAQIKNKQIDAQKDLTDDEIIATIKKEIKSIKEAAEFLKQAGKEEELQQELAKAAVLQAYLPEVMNEEQTRELIEKLVAELWITDLNKQRGQLMWAIMKDYKSDVDGSLVNQIVTSMI